MTETLSRAQILSTASAERIWDVIVIGGGATGLGTALEACTRGYTTLLLEARDFSNATSSRSTKLVHGGVRYLKQGNIKLVLEALQERARMMRNAPHLAHRQSFVIPGYSALDMPMYGIGLTAYDLLAGKASVGRSRLLSATKVHELLPTVQREGLKGGVLYYDGQFDDARYAISLMQTIVDKGGLALNYMPARALLKSNGAISGVTAEDVETGVHMDFQAKCVINATGIFADDLRRMDDAQTEPMLLVSQGSHIVLPREYLPGNDALMIPKTADGRVLFAIPWHGSVVIGTTDQPVAGPQWEPRAMQDEKKFLADNVRHYLACKLRGEDILSVWSGQRPLVRKAGTSSTAATPRDHTILVSPSKLITITGGKWTTYRKMGQDAIETAIASAGLAATQSATAQLHLHGWVSPTPEEQSDNDWKFVYGSDLPAIETLAQNQPENAALLHPALPYRKVDVLWAVMHEMARTVDDVLSRRTRALFLNARASIEAAPEVARLLAVTLGRNELWQQNQIESFRAEAQTYMWND